MQISASASVPSVTPEGASPSTTPGASSQPAASPTATVESCTTYAATHTFLHLTAAKQNADGSLTVAGNHATMVCGGPDDLHYDFASDTVTGHVTASASLQVLSFPGPKLVAITHARFASYLVADQNIRVFVVTGPLAAITALTEQYHP